MAAALMLAVSGTATAQQSATSGFYVGADIGQSKLGNYGFGDQEAFATRDDTDTSFRFNVGYRFSEYFTLETGAADFGSFDTDVAMVCIAIVGVDCTHRVSTSMDGAFINAMGTWPLGRHVYLSATVGAFYYRADTRVALDTTTTAARTSDSGTVAQYGVGVGFPINDRFTITLDWQRIEGASIHPWPVSPSLRHDADLTNLTAGVRFFF
jgi:hypothetical protein